MADEAPILGTTWVEIRPDASKLSPAFAAAEKQAQSTAKVIENNLGTSLKATQDAATKLEKAIVAGSPRMQYSYYQATAALRNFEDQIKRTTASGGTLTGDQVKQYALLKSKIDEMTPSLESQRRVMIAARAELQAGIGAWNGYEHAIARVLSDLGVEGAGEKALIAGGIFAALEAGLATGEKFRKILGTDMEAYDSFWKDVAKSGKKTQEGLVDWISNKWNSSPAYRVATMMLFGIGPGAWDKAELNVRGSSRGGRATDQASDHEDTPQETAMKNTVSGRNKWWLEQQKERADAINDTAAVERYTEKLRDLELIEEGYTDKLMANGDAIRKHTVLEEAHTRAIVTGAKAEEDRSKAFNKSVDQLFKHEDLKNKFFQLSPIPKDFAADPYTGWLGEIDKKLVAVGRSMKDDREQLRLLAREAATAGAESDMGKYGASYREHLNDPGKGITRDEYMDLIRRRRAELNADLQKIDEQYSTSVSIMLDRMAKKYGSTYDQIQVLADRLVTDIQSNFESGFFNAITGNIKGVKDAFKSMLDSMLRDVINFVVRQEVQQLLKMLAFQFGGYSTYAGYAGTWISSTASIPSAGNVAAAGLVRNVVSASSFGGTVGSGGGGGGGRDQMIHVSLEPGLIGRVVSLSAEAGRQRVLADFNDNGPARLTIRRNG